MIFIFCLWGSNLNIISGELGFSDFIDKNKVNYLLIIVVVVFIFGVCLLGVIIVFFSGFCVIKGKVRIYYCSK